MDTTEKKRRMDGAENNDTSTPTTLCDLPDEVLHQILSLIPTRDVVRISMASKRLESLWRSIPKLEFHRTFYYREPETRLFMDSVDRSIRLRAEGSSITQFSLSCSVASYFDASRVSKWISDVVLRHNVQDLWLHLNPAPFNPIELLPSCVFRSENLRKLHLRGPGVLPIPPRVCLPNLKDLTIEGVNLVDHELTEKLLSSPSLVRLSIDGCNFKTSKPITVSAPMLNSLFVSTDDMCPDLVVHAPNLKHSTFYCGELTKRFVISGSPVLDEVVIDTSYSERTALLRLLQDTSAVKNQLTLSGGVLWQLGRENDPSDFIPVFFNLKKLTLRGKGSSYVCLDSDKLSSLLRRCPSIETLEIQDVGLFGTPEGRDQHPFMSNLKKITMDCSIVCEKMLPAVGFLLMSAPVLEELVLKSPLFWRVQPELLDRFSKLPRISKRCSIRIVS